MVFFSFLFLLNNVPRWEAGSIFQTPNGISREHNVEKYNQVMIAHERCAKVIEQLRMYSRSKATERACSHVRASDAGLQISVAAAHACEPSSLPSVKGIKRM